MNKQTEILNECKKDIAIGLGLESWKHLIEDNNWNKYGRYASKELAILFAQRMSELFAEWIEEKKNHVAEYSTSFKATSELYTEFLNQINKEK